MKVVCFAGFSNSGKTTLIERIIPALKARAQRVSIIKHAHHRFDIDHPGKDSWRHRQAGAFEVLIASDNRFALMHENETPQQPDVLELIARLSPGVDWVLVEGFKESHLPKVEVWRAETNDYQEKPLLHPGDARVRAIITSAPQHLPQSCALPVLDWGNTEQVVQWLMDNASLFTWPQR